MFLPEYSLTVLMVSLPDLIIISPSLSPDLTGADTDDSVLYSYVISSPPFFFYILSVSSYIGITDFSIPFITFTVEI